MRKRKHALVLRLLTSDGSNTALPSWCQLYARSFDVPIWHEGDIGWSLSNIRFNPES
jgi:hypothetical protein